MLDRFHLSSACSKAIGFGLIALAWVGIGIVFLPTRTFAAVTVSSFKAQLQTNQVQLTWRTASEVNNAGFNILRSTSANGTYQKINPNLIPPKFSISGADYSYTDSTITSGQTYYYKLQAVATNGSTENFGPQSVAFGSPAPTATNTPAPSATKTNTPPAPTATKTSTSAPTSAVATPTRTSTAVATAVPSTQPQSANTPLPPTKVAVVVAPPKSTEPSASAPEALPPTDETSNSMSDATPQSEATQETSTAEEPMMEDENVILDTPAPTDWTRIVLTLGVYGLSGLFGLGGFLLSAATIYYLLNLSKR